MILDLEFIKTLSFAACNEIYFKRCMTDKHPHYSHGGLMPQYADQFDSEQRELEELNQIVKRKYKELNEDIKIH